MKAITSQRLRLDPFTGDDAAFILTLLNEPSFLRYVGDKGVRTLGDARDYLESGPIASYREHGFGLLAVRLQGQEEPIGMCGLLERPTLDHPDIGFAFLPAHWGLGYASEAAETVLGHARATLGLGRIVAITSLDNPRSGHLLGRLGFVDAGTKRLDADGDPVRIYVSDPE